MSGTRIEGEGAEDRTVVHYESDDERWAAVVNRDRQAEGHFVLCVVTTGIYCRPGCSARRPRRENVRFLARCEEAERAGFRPCKRCRPNELSPEARRAESVATACRLIEEAQEMPDLGALAEAAGMSRFHFHRVFKAATGITPRAYAAAHRARRLRESLRKGAALTDAIYGAGFGSGSRFYDSSTEILGMAPASYRRGGRAEIIRFALGECSLGSILVAATEKGVCAILLGDDPDGLLRDLEKRFANARLVGGDEAFEGRVARVIALVEAPALGHDLPLDVRGTAFQQRVWQALQAIAPGSTASYAEIADRVGAPGAARAVAQACGSNPVAVAIPCHRVVRRDGALSGYRWGVERKRVLLEREAEAPCGMGMAGGSTANRGWSEPSSPQS